MECMPLDVLNRGQQCEYNGINVHDVIMLEISWLCMVVDGSTLPCGSFILSPTLNPFLSPKQHPTTTICDINNGQQHCIIHQGKGLSPTVPPTSSNAECGALHDDVDGYSWGQNFGEYMHEKLLYYSCTESYRSKKL